MDKDVELLKIQVYADYCHSFYTGAVLLSMSAMLSFSIAWMVLFVEIGMNPVGYFLFLFLFVGGFGGLGIWYYYRYRKRLERIDKLIERLNKGEPLPSIKDLMKKKE